MEVSHNKKEHVMLAIIGGSRLSQLPVLQITHRQIVRTPYGDPSCALTFGLIGARTVVFLARHGEGHRLLPWIPQVVKRVDIAAGRIDVDWGTDW